jgi:hypothetical protein
VYERRPAGSGAINAGASLGESASAEVELAQLRYALFALGYNLADGHSGLISRRARLNWFKHASMSNNSRASAKVTSKHSSIFRRHSKIYNRRQLHNLLLKMFVFIFQCSSCSDVLCRRKLSDCTKQSPSSSRISRHRQTRPMSCRRPWIASV